MKIINLFILFLLYNLKSVDILSNQQHLVIYADGINYNFLDKTMPIINSWRKHKLEVTNLCKIIECNYDYLPNTKNRFSTNKCLIENNKNCEIKNEKEGIFKFEELIQNSDYINHIDLNGEKFGLTANSKTEEGIVFLFGGKGMDDCLKEKRLNFLKNQNEKIKPKH